MLDEKILNEFNRTSLFNPQLKELEKQVKAKHRYKKNLEDLTAELTNSKYSIIKREMSALSQAFTNPESHSSDPRTDPLFNQNIKSYLRFLMRKYPNVEWDPNSILNNRNIQQWLLDQKSQYPEDFNDFLQLPSIPGALEDRSPRSRKDVKIAKYIAYLSNRYPQSSIISPTASLNEVYNWYDQQKTTQEFRDFNNLNLRNMKQSVSVKMSNIPSDAKIPTEISIDGRVHKLQDANLKFGSGKMNNIELKLRNIVDKGTPKTITINGKKHYISKAKIENVKNQEEKNGGILPLIPILLGALGAVGATAGGAASIAKAVNDKKSQDAMLEEERRHNLELEKTVKGSGVKDAIKEFVKRSGLEENSKRFLKNTLYNLADSVKIEKQGNGLYLQPWPGK